MKYIYFEIHTVDGGPYPQSPTMQHENILLIKPNTNSSGIWGFRNITKTSSALIIDRYSQVDQNWIDLTKYKFGDDFNRDNQIIKCIDKLNTQLRELKLERILQ